MTRLRSALVILSAVALAGCDEDGTDMIVPHRYPAAAIILGQVTDPDGAGITGVRVRMTAILPSDGPFVLGPCRGVRINVAEVITLSGGTYYTTFRAGLGAMQACVVVEAFPPASAALEPALVSGPVRFVPEAPNALLESVTFDVQLGPAP